MNAKEEVAIYSTVRYHDGDRWVAALMKRGLKYLHLVCIDDVGVVVKREPIEEERYLHPLTYRGRTYPIPRAVRLFKQVGRERSITVAAKTILDEAKETY